MNDLQLALLGVGGSLIAAVWGHGKWQEWRQRRLAESLLNPDTGDALMNSRGAKPAPSAAFKNAAPSTVSRKENVDGEGRREPAIGVSEPRNEGFQESTLTTQASSAGKFSSAHISPAPVNAPLPDVDEPDTSLVSAEADFVASFTLAELTTGEQLLAIPRDAFSLLRKRVVWVGYAEKAARWELIHPSGHYRLLRIGIQLADRTGPVNAMLLDQFKKAVEYVADELTALAVYPSTLEALARAVNLDRLCAEVDIQLAVYLAPRHDHFSPEVVRDLALEKGFNLDSEGVLGYHDAAGDRLFLLQMPDARAPDGLPAPTACCILEVPCVAQGELAFDRMMRVAQELADALDALLVDEHRRPITERFVAPVRQQIGQLQSRMAQQGVKAGSPLAWRLFS